MGLISKLLLKNYSMADFDRDVKSYISGRPTYSGAKVNEHTALRYITFYSCVRVRSESLAMLPLSVYRKRRNSKGRDEAYDHPVQDKIHASPNGEMTSLTWRETMNGHLDASGNCYSIITTNQRGQVIDLYPWPWDQVEVIRNRDTKKLEYHIYEKGLKVETLPPERVLHIPGLGYDGVKGYSVISMIREYIGLGLSVNEFIQRFYGQGMNVGSIFETEQEMKQEAVDDLRDQLIQKGAGLANSWLPLVLHSGLKFNRIPMSLIDAQTLEILKLTDDQICGLMRVPPHMVANLDRSTNNNIEHQSIEYVQYSMLPVTTRFEQNMNWKLFTPAERAGGYYVKFNVDALLRGDAKARAEYLSKKRQNGVINADEWRALDDENPIGGVAGTAYLVNGAMTSTETAAKQQPKQTQITVASKESPENSISKKGRNIQANMDPDEWQEEYEEGNAHWADDLQPSLFAQNFVEKLREENIEGTLLEIGCGNGRDSIFFARANFEVTAVDVAPAALEIAKENAENAGVEITFVEANAEELPFDDSSFNALFTLSVLHASDLNKSIPETARVLVSGGLMSIYIYGNTESVSGETETHTTVDGFIDLLKENGYEILDFYSEQEDEYDEAGEKHQILVALCRKGD